MGRDTPNPTSTPPPRRRAAARRLFGGAISVAVHLGVGVFLVAALSSPLMPAETPPVIVQLVDLRPPAPVQAPPIPAKPTPVQPPAAPAKPNPIQPPAVTAIARKTPAPAHNATLAASDVDASEQGNALSDAQIAGAASADSGPSGRPCDMARWLQSALRKDPLVQAAVAGAAGKAIMVWDGDWVRNRGEDGKGLAAVREAILWEVAFAPEACRAEPVHGLVLLSMGQAGGSTRLALGQSAWRWSDLLRSGGAG
jgi:hypothetical protein